MERAHRAHSNNQDCQSFNATRSRDWQSYGLFNLL